MRDKTTDQGPVLFICLVLFLDAVGFGLILPVLPDLIGALSDLPNNRSAEVAGFLLFTFAGMQFICAPILGGLSDRYGRRPVLLLSLLGFTVAYFLMAAASSLAWLFVARIISGLFGATFTAANAFIVDISTPEERPRLFGLTGAAVALGFVFGPAIGGLLGEYGARMPFVVAGILSALTVLYGVVFLPETLVEKNRRAFALKRANPFGSLLAMRHHPFVLAIIAVIFLLQLANQSFASIWAFFTIEIADWSPFQIGVSVAFYGGILAIAQGGLTGPVVARLGEVRAVIASLSIGIISYGLLATASLGWHIYAAIFIGGFSAFALPSMQSLMTRRIPENAQGELQGAIASTYSLAAIIGPIAMSQVFGAFSSGSGLYFPGAPFLAGSGLILLALAVFSIAIQRRERGLRDH